MSLRRSSERSKNSRSPHDSSDRYRSGRHRSRSPHRHHRDEERRKPEKPRHGSAEVDLRRVKQEPKDETNAGRPDRQGSSHSPSGRHSHGDRSSRRREEFRDQREERRRNDIQRINQRTERAPSDEQWGRDKKPDDGKKQPKKEKEKASLALSGNLTADTNTFRGVVIKYNEPPEARRPKKRWRFYPFKGEEQLPVLHLHRQSAFLLGRDRRIADIPVDHPSCSKQHAVLQFRLVDYVRPDGRKGRRVRPYVIDLGSANGTYVNNQRIEPQRYVELMEKDVVKFGFSSREYVLLHDSSDTSELEDDEGEAE